MAPEYRLTLFVSGSDMKSERAMANLRDVCQERWQCQLTVVDVLERPDLAERAKILATPLLLRESPGPALRVIGDMSDAEALVARIAIDAGAGAGADEDPCRLAAVERHGEERP